MGGVPDAHLTFVHVIAADPPFVNSNIAPQAIGLAKGFENVNVVVPATVAEMKFPKVKLIVLVPEPLPST